VLTVVPEESNSSDDHACGGGAAASVSLIDEIVRDGAQRMLGEALQAEVEAYIAQFREERDEHGRRLVVRNGSPRVSQFSLIMFRRRPRRRGRPGFLAGWPAQGMSREIWRR
jgi:hypothetical protein